MLQHWGFWTLTGYLCGSLPFALLIGRAKGVDIRELGSGNVGATNVGRTLGTRWGVLCFLLDVTKGAAPVLGAGWVMGWAGRYDLTTAQAWCWLAVAAAAMLGHIYPIWLGFRGGKGVATGLGAVLGFWPILTLPGLVAAAVWVVVLALWRYVSLASIAAVATIPLILLAKAWANQQRFSDFTPFLICTGTLAILVGFRHRSNLARLRAGTEAKLGMAGTTPRS